ncbi:MAG: SGNH/GDSL hydrolase family protein, partial [Spirulinaceae cyanobacterium RM2_2_10]|nr:SGNH/GDSL hydrolase family protein [Spirulinaceae cyanobacterium RM2_2_10]
MAGDRGAIDHGLHGDRRASAIADRQLGSAIFVVARLVEVRRWGWQRWAVGLLAIAIASEFALRWGFGLGNPVLLQADPALGYRFQPDQDLRRFGNRIRYNQYSQRSEPPLEPRSPDQARILLTGDSVLNGGTLADQSETIPAYMAAIWTAQGQSVELLNASAGSWGLGNQLAYLQTFGFFDSDLLIIFVGTHDLVQPTSTSAVVGNHPDFPSRRPLLAWQELWTRYLWRRYLQPRWWRWRSQPLLPPPEPPTAAVLEAQV